MFYDAVTIFSLFAVLVPLADAAILGGINIAGCDFGCGNDGSCGGGSQCPSDVGPTQMEHFASTDGFNTFRIPVGWQYLVDNQVSSTALSGSFFPKYDALIQSCLKQRATCILDIHNYARWNGQIIGQSAAVTTENFVSLWTLLAQKYAKESKVAFGIMNEPHELDIAKWAETVQAVVTAIRKAGATNQLILLPGTQFTSVQSFAKESAPSLEKVTNPDGSSTGLLFDVHRYFDSDFSGKGTECTNDGIQDGFAPLAAYLRQNRRQAFVSELGGGNTDSCVKFVKSALEYLRNNSDVYAGFTTWAAGSFQSGYELAETPNGSTDTRLVQDAIAPQVLAEAGTPSGSMSAKGAQNSKGTSSGSNSSSAKNPSSGYSLHSSNGQNAPPQAKSRLDNESPDSGPSTSSPSSGSSPSTSNPSSGLSPASSPPSSSGLSPPSALPPAPAFPPSSVPPSSGPPPAPPSNIFPFSNLSPFPKGEQPSILPSKGSNPPPEPLPPSPSGQSGKSHLTSTAPSSGQVPAPADHPSTEASAPADPCPPSPNTNTKKEKEKSHSKGKGQGKDNAGFPSLGTNAPSHPNTANKTLVSGNDPQKSHKKSHIENKSGTENPTPPDKNIN